jgi:hypothetical protein
MINETPSAEDPEQHADIVIFCDESGAKGYAEKPEQISGEIGVFAGFFIPRSLIKPVSSIFRDALSHFRSEGRKMHIAEVAPEQRGTLQQAVFDLFLTYRIPCFYEAIHSEGIHAIHQTQVEAVEKVLASKRSNANKSRRRIRGRLLHAELFQALYGKILAFCAKSGKTRLEVEVLVDRVDDAILEQFRIDAKRLLEDERVVEIPFKDPTTGKRHKAKLILRLLNQPAPVSVSKCVVNLTSEHRELLLAADVLSNSLYGHLLNRPEEMKFHPLNSREAVSTHPLARFLNLGQPNFDFSDSFLSHPQSPKRKGQ